jgi:tetratricopeptide (TPR) repeat protein
VVGGLIDEASRLTAADAARALTVSEMVVRLADDGCSKLARARARRALARALSYGGRFEESLAVCREGMGLAEEGGSSIEAGRAKLASMHALGELGRLDEAIATGQAAREAFIAAGDAALAARADINIGIAEHRRDDPASAVACFERARPALLNEPLMLGHLDNSRGEALLALHDFKGAEGAFAAALSAFEQARAGLTAAIAEGNLADLAARQGRLQDALYRFERARRRLASDSTPGHVARLRTEQAEAMSVLGMPGEALREYEAALPELDGSGLALEAARARMGMGMALIRLGRLAQAETALAAAATGFEELGHATARARVDLARAQIAAANRRYSEARGMVMRALAAVLEI